jgi:hypothetical protein
LAEVDAPTVVIATITPITPMSEAEVSLYLFIEFASLLNFLTTRPVYPVLL